MRKHISFSEIKIWDECSYKHKLVYIDEVKKFLGNEYTAFGTAIHEVCEKSILGQVSLEKKSLVDLFENKFLEELKSLSQKKVELNKNLVSDMRSQAKDLLTHILPAVKNYFQEYEVFSAEEQLYIPVENSQTFYNKRWKISCNRLENMLLGLGF